MSLRNTAQMLLKCKFSRANWDKSGANSDALNSGNGTSKKLRLMKLLPSFYVFTGEGKAKLYVAEKDHDEQCL